MCVCEIAFSYGVLYLAESHQNYYTWTGYPYNKPFHMNIISVTYYADFTVCERVQCLLLFFFTILIASDSWMQ